MASSNDSSITLTCPVCETEIIALFEKQVDNMRYYRCPNQLNPGETHMIAVSDEEKDEPGNFTENLYDTPEESSEFTPGDHIQSSSRKSRLEKTVDDGLRLLGAQYVMKRLFSDKSTEDGAQAQHIESIPVHKPGLSEEETQKIIEDSPDIPDSDLDIDVDIFPEGMD